MRHPYVFLFVTVEGLPEHHWLLSWAAKRPMISGSLLPVPHLLARFQVLWVQDSSLIHVCIQRNQHRAEEKASTHLLLNQSKKTALNHSTEQLLYFRYWFKYRICIHLYDSWDRCSCDHELCLPGRSCWTLGLLLPPSAQAHWIEHGGESPKLMKRTGKHLQKDFPCANAI